MKLDIRETIIEALAFCRANYRKLAVFAVIRLLFNLLSALNSYCGAIYPQTLQSTVLLLLIILILFVFMPKFVLAIPIYISFLFTDKAISFKEAYKKIKGKYWTYLLYFALRFAVYKCTYYYGVQENSWERKLT